MAEFGKKNPQKTQIFMSNVCRDFGIWIGVQQYFQQYFSFIWGGNWRKQLHVPGILDHMMLYWVHSHGNCNFNSDCLGRYKSNCHTLIQNLVHDSPETNESVKILVNKLSWSYMFRLQELLAIISICSDNFRQTNSDTPWVWWPIVLI